LFGIYQFLQSEIIGRTHLILIRVVIHDEIVHELHWSRNFFLVGGMMLLLFLMDVCSCTLVYVRFTCPSKASVMQFNLENDSVNDKYLKNPSFFLGGGGAEEAAAAVL
jgi:hypothetical protein